MNFALLLAAGFGSRFGNAVLKQRARLAGRAVYEHTLERLQNCESIFGILLLTNEDLLPERADIKRRYPKVLDVIKGGATRLESSHIGLRYLALIAEPGSKVIIHDAVRPFVDDALIERILSALDEYDAVDPVIDSTDTIILTNDGFIESIPNRRMVKRGQTPQGFNFKAISEAYERAFTSGDDLSFSDDCGLFLKYAEGFDPRVRLIKGSEDNIKVTYPIDLTMAEAILRRSRIAGMQRKTTLRNKTILLIGGHGGLGSMIETRLSEVGMKVISLSRKDGLDVCDAGTLEVKFKETREKIGPIDAIVNLAAELSTGSLHEQSPAAIEAMVLTNLLGSVWVARAALPFLIETRGQLLFFSSSSYMYGRKGQAVYAATKAGVSNLTQGLAQEWESLGVRVNCLAPSRAATQMRTANFSVQDDLRDMITPEQVAIKVEMILSADVTGFTFLGGCVPDIF
jgi:ribitol-5-phosphate 2-dehydrogenase (NADP+) / D-ribitol-5-phosphate cytidylyltransferase